MVRSRVVLLLMIRAWPGPYDPSLQMPTVSSRVTVLWAWSHQYEWYASPGLLGQSYSHSGKIPLGI